MLGIHPLSAYRSQVFILFSRFPRTCSYIAHKLWHIIDMSRMYYLNTGVPLDFLRSCINSAYSRVYLVLRSCSSKYFHYLCPSRCVRRFLELLLRNTHQIWPNGLVLLSVFECNLRAFLWNDYWVNIPLLNRFLFFFGERPKICRWQTCGSLEMEIVQIVSLWLFYFLLNHWRLLD